MRKLLKFCCVQRQKITINMFYATECNTICLLVWSSTRFYSDTKHSAAKQFWEKLAEGKVIEKLGFFRRKIVTKLCFCKRNACNRERCKSMSNYICQPKKSNFPFAGLNALFCPHHFHFIIHWSCYHSMQYNLRLKELLNKS